MISKPRDATHMAKTVFGWAYAKNIKGKGFIHVYNTWKESVAQNVEVKPLDK
ncbi:hypothetical protein ABH305_05115 [Acinetobacter pittii]|uniref:hypothetical protein n=1 Tax=Acinetobacter pittii TaxID=48296 RepID=UPI003260A3E2